MSSHSQQLGFLLFSSLQLPLSTIFISIICFSLTLSTSNGIENHYRECSSLVSCGNISNVGYPFWGDHLRPQYCGHPAFELECPRQGSTSPPTLHIHGNQSSSLYSVLSINSSAMTILLQDFLPYNPPEDCLIPSSNLTDALGEDLIEYSPGVNIITLSYDCNQSKVEALVRLKNLSCLPEDAGTDIGYYYWNNQESEDELNRICKQSIKVPVIGKKHIEQGNVTLESVLKQGFEITYAKMFVNHCLPCQKSGGACSFSEVSGFVCYCKGRESSNYCKKSGHQGRHVPSDAHTARKSSKNNHKLIFYIAIPGAASFIILTTIVAVLFCLKKSNFCSQTLHSMRTSYNRMWSDLEFGNGIHVFSHTELREATNNFDPARELGDGGFGVVYYGKLRDGREVAVKHLFETNYKRVEQFRNEVAILTQLSHPNLVTLYGCTSRRTQELLLVYEYIPNGTVADHLHGDRSQPGSLTWNLRMKIAIQTAEALSYLHATGIIHRDVKTNNILLDNYFCVKVADFGLSRFFPFDATHVSTIPHGTPGYLDPEYEKFYQVTSKSDVYSLGVVLLELISSLPAIDVTRDEDEIKLSSYGVNKIKCGKLSELVDEKLGIKSDLKVIRMVSMVAELALQCLHQEKEIRPSMDEVLQTLKQIESLEYEALEEAEISKQASEAAENEVEQPLRNAQMRSWSSTSNCELGHLTQIAKSHSCPTFKNVRQNNMLGSIQ